MRKKTEISHVFQNVEFFRNGTEKIDFQKLLEHLNAKFIDIVLRSGIVQVHLTLGEISSVNLLFTEYEEE